MTPREFSARLSFWKNADRIGVDIPTTYWRLYFTSTMNNLCTNKFAKFGEGAEFRPGAFAEACSKIYIGRNVVIRPGTFLFADPRDGGGTITIEDDVLIGAGVHLYTNNHKFRNSNIPIINQGYLPASPSDSIIVRKVSWIGAGVIILPGIEIGENSVIGAGSIVTKSVSPRSVYAGNPAILIDRIE